jgi:ubiquinone biosynthesis protein
LSSGEDVVVKVRRPGIKEKAETDLDIMKAVSGRAENLSKVLSNMRIHNLVQEFGEWFKDEMDFEKEARNAKTIKRNMSDVDNVKVPKVYEQHSTEKVLVMEYVDGVKCTEDEKLKQLDVDMAEITHTGIEMGLKQVIRDGMFHADPHPSNFFIDEEGRIILIDFGMVGKLTKKSRRRLGRTRTLSQR